MKKSFKFLMPLLTVGVLAYLFPFFESALTQTSQKTLSIPLPTAKNAPVLKLNDPLPANLFIELAKAINPAVVNIQTQILPKQRRMRDPYFEMLEQLYGLQMMPNLVMPQQQPAHSLGTGFIIREDGLIITNNHVIEGADVIKVQMTEGSEKTFEAKVIGRDSRTDIALIKVNTGSKLPYVVLGSSKDVEVGEWVTAFGNPFGHGHTMTKGIISAKGRSIDEINKFPFLQTDASINPGNSGGPLVNSKGLVIGVNTAIDPRAQNIGFAIPIDDVKTILPDLEKDGGIKKGYLGVGLADIDMNAANSLNLTSPEGSIIVNVEPHGPASKAGLKNYDVVIEFDGKKIKSSSDLMNAVADSKIGVAIPLKVIRDGKNKNLSIEIGERPSARVAHKNELPKNQMGQKDKLDIGLSVSDLTPQLREEFQIPDAIENHPIVLEIQNDSPALRSGIRPGDLILDVNRKEVKTAKEVLSSLHKGTNTIRIARGEGIRIFVLDSK